MTVRGWASNLFQASQQWHAIGEPVVAHQLPDVLDCISMLPLYTGFLLALS